MAVAAELLAAAHSSGTRSPGTRVPETAPAGSAVVPPTPARTTDCLANAVFHAHNSEAQMLRYRLRISDADHALDRGMLLLGLCTKKFNATAEMAAITWPEFANLHPFEHTTWTTALRTGTLSGAPRPAHGTVHRTGVRTPEHPERKRCSRLAWFRAPSTGPWFAGSTRRMGTGPRLLCYARAE